MRDLELIGRHAAFEGITGGNLDMMVECIIEGVYPVNAGEVVLLDETMDPYSVLILQGELEVYLSTGEIRIMGKDEAFGKEFFEDSQLGYVKKVKALQDSQVMMIKNHNAFIPCWFSCFFHEKFRDNLRKIKDNQRNRKEISQ